jgi:hypothetical protein
MGKGDRRRPCLVSRKELDLRIKYMNGKISLPYFNRKLGEIRKAGKK